MSTPGRRHRFDNSSSSPPAERSLYAEFANDHDWHDHETTAMTSLNSTGSPLAAVNTPSAGAHDTEPVQISVGQRMLSATGGSILTSLLGKCFLFIYFCRDWLQLTAFSLEQSPLWMSCGFVFNRSHRLSTIHLNSRHTQPKHLKRYPPILE